MSRKRFSSRSRTCEELRVRLGHRLLERRPRAVGVERPRRADPGHDVLALCVRKVLAVERLLAGRRVAREGHAGRRAVAPVAEDHRLHVDGRAPLVRDVVELAVGLRALVVPGPEDRADRSPELLARVVREIVRRFAGGRSPRTAPHDLGAGPRPSGPRRTGRRDFRLDLRQAFSNSCRGTSQDDVRRTSARNRRRQSSANRSPARGGEALDAAESSGRGSGSCPSCPASTSGRPSGPRRGAGSAGRRTAGRSSARAGASAVLDLGLDAVEDAPCGVRRRRPTCRS